MPQHLTSVIEFSGGILLPGPGFHTITVLGARRRSRYEGSAAAKEDLIGRTSNAIYEEYYSGDLKGTQQDPESKPYHPRVPALFITRDGRTEFLHREFPESGSSAGTTSSQQP